MQEFKKNLLDLVGQFGIACIDLDEAERDPRRDMGKHLNAARAKCDDLCRQIAQQLDKITAVEQRNNFTYKANVYGPTFVIDQVDIEVNREGVVYLKAGLSFTKANQEFIQLTGKGISTVKNVRIFPCYDREDFDQTHVEHGNFWIVTDEHGMVLEVADLT